MQITVNGKAREVKAGSSLSGLIQELRLEPTTVVAELNGEILGREDFETCKLSEGDRVELVRLVGGG
jgi:sulfur carrier protein